MPPGSPTPEPDENAIFYTHFQTRSRGSLTSMKRVIIAMYMFTWVKEQGEIMSS